MLDTLLAALSSTALLIILLATGYLFLFALASCRRPGPRSDRQGPPTTRFLIAIPAHDEENVIAATVRRLRELDYPNEQVVIHIVADHCSDRTALFAASEGAVVHERRDGPRSGKGAALAWLFQQAPLLEADAVIVFDSDTRVDGKFLQVMDARLAAGDPVIQGQHVIANPGAGRFAALTWAMFLVDNRFQNLGRSNIGLSAKNMGDSICFRSRILQEVGWGEGLADDHQLRNRLLLQSIRIRYEPEAIGAGEAPATWREAQAQRARWLRGTSDTSRGYAGQLLRQGIRRRDAAMIDGAIQAVMPSYSSLALLVCLALAGQMTVMTLWGVNLPSTLHYAWAGVLCALFAYPFLGLALEGAPFLAYQAILAGPLYILWRTWLAARVRLTRSQIGWIRTAHSGQEGGRRE